MALTTQAVPPRRGRGRPPKLQTVTAGRGRGRPPKLQSATVRHLGRGRPPKLLVKLPRRGRGRPPKQSTQHASQLPATPGTSGMQSSKVETPRQGTAGTDDPGGGSGTTTAGTSHQDWGEKPVLPTIYQQMTSLMESMRQASSEDENDLVQMSLIFFQAMLEHFTRRSIGMEITVWASRNSGKAFIHLPPSLSKLQSDPRYDMAKMLEAIRTFTDVDEDVNPIKNFCSYLASKEEDWLNDYEEAVREILPSELKEADDVACESSVSPDVSDHDVTDENEDRGNIFKPLARRSSMETLDMQCEDVSDDGPRTRKKSIRHLVIQLKPSLVKKYSKNVATPPGSVSKGTPPKKGAVGNEKASSSSISDVKQEDVDSSTAADCYGDGLRNSQKMTLSSPSQKSYGVPFVSLGLSDEVMTGELPGDVLVETDSDDGGPAGFDYSLADECAMDQLDPSLDQANVKYPKVVNIVPIPDDPKCEPSPSKRKADTAELNSTPPKRRRAVSAKMAEMMADIRMKEERKWARKQQKMPTKSTSKGEAAQMIESMSKRYPVVELGRIYLNDSKSSEPDISVDDKMKEMGSGDLEEIENINVKTNESSEAVTDLDDSTDVLVATSPSKRVTFPDDGKPALPQEQWKGFQCRFCHIEGKVFECSDWNSLSSHIGEKHFIKLSEKESGLRCPFCAHILSTRINDRIQCVQRLFKHTQLRHKRTLSMPSIEQSSNTMARKESANGLTSEIKLNETLADKQQEVSTEKVIEEVMEESENKGREGSLNEVREVSEDKSLLKLFSCPACTEEGDHYPNRAELINHLSKQHCVIIGIHKVMQCKECEESFKSRAKRFEKTETLSRYLKHMEEQHGKFCPNIIEGSPEEVREVSEDKAVEAVDFGPTPSAVKFETSLVPFPSQKYQTNLKANARKRIKHSVSVPHFRSFLKLFSCPACTEVDRFPTKAQLIDHINKQHVTLIDVSRVMQCKECELSFKSQAKKFKKKETLFRYLKHMEEQHGKFCLYFIDEEKWEAKLNEEKDLTSEEGQGVWKCFLCQHGNRAKPVSFTKQCLLTKHLLEEHRTPEGLITCPLCSFDKRVFQLLKWEDATKYGKHCVLSHNMLHGSHLTDALDMASVASVYKKVGEPLPADHKLSIKYGIIMGQQSVMEPDGLYFDTMKCFLCPKQGPAYRLDDRSYVEHMRGHMERIEELSIDGSPRCTLKCPQCDFSVIRCSDVMSKSTPVTYAVTILLDHMIKEHRHAIPDFTKVYICFCGHETLLKLEYCEHVTCTHKKNINSLALRDCPACDMTLAPGVTWRSHKLLCEGNVPERVLDQGEQEPPEGMLCPECGHIYKTQLSLTMHRWKNHKVNTSSEELAPCSKCGELVPPCFMTIHKYQHSHKKKVPNRIVFCPECGIRISNSQALLRHRWRLHKVNAYHQPLVSCLECDEKIPPSFIRDHMTMHARIDNPVVVKTSSEGIAYRRRSEKIKLTETECPECEKQFSSSTNLRRHMWAVHEINITNDQMSPCASCGQVMPAFYLAVHKYRDHNPHTGQLIIRTRGMKPYSKRQDWDLPNDNVCTVCSKKFSNKSSMARHLWRVHEINAYNEELMKCELCGDEVPPSFMAVHRSRKHDPETGATKWKSNKSNWSLPEDNTCQICCRGYATSTSLVRHLWRIHEINAYNEPLAGCEICGDKMPISFLSVHRGRHTDLNRVVKKLPGPRKPPRIRGREPADAGNKQCPECGKFVSDIESLKRHRWRIHKVNAFQAALVPCSICGEMIPTSFRATHEYQHARQEEQEIRKAEKKAKRARGENVIKALPFQCEICGKRVLNRYVLAQHKKKAHTDRPAAYECGFCGYTCRESKKHLMRHHLATKHGIFTYLCKICRFSCDTQEELDAHMLDRHPKGSEMNHCTECDIKLGSKRLYENHMFEAHKVYLSKRPVRRCPSCDFETLIPRALIDHIGEAHQEMHVKCPVCQKSFFTQALCDTHMRIHDPIEKMKCEHCDFTTRSNKVFQYHLYQQHGIQYNAFSSPLSIKDEAEDSFAGTPVNAVASTPTTFDLNTPAVTPDGTLVTPTTAIITHTVAPARYGKPGRSTTSGARKLLASPSMVASAVASIQGEAIDSTVDAVQPADHDVSIDVTPIIAEAETTTLDDISSDVVVDQPQMTSRIVQIIDEKTGETVQTYTLNMPQASDQLIPTSEGMDETVVIEDPNNSLISGLLNAADGQSMVLADQNPPSEAQLQTITIPISTSGESGEQVEYVSLPGMSDGQEVIAYEAQVGDGGEEGVEYVFIL